MTQTPDQLLDEAIAEVVPEGPACPLSPLDIAPDSPPPVYEPFLGDYTLTVAEDHLTATISFPPLKGERRPEFDALKQVLAQKHKLVGIDESALATVVDDAFRAADAPVSAVIAQGKAPVDGEDGRIEWLGDFFESRAIVMPDGSVDHYRHTKVSVYEGQPVVQIHAPTKGTSGCDVHGKSVRPRPGEPAKLEHDDSLRPDVHDASILVAARPGMVENARGKVTVSDVQIVDAVDFSTGSIEFEGAVQIRNQVDPKFSVYGAGTVIIGGPVENAHIESKKNIQIDKGVMGHGSAVISCHGDLFLGFARDAAIHCGGRLVARREMLWCEGEVHGDLLCEAGRIVGGHWRVGGRVVLDELGSREEVTTILTLGEAPEQNRALVRLTRDRKNAQSQLEEFRRRYGPILRGGIGTLAPSEREALLHRKYVFERQASRTRKREYLLRSRLVQQRRHSFAWVKTRIHPGVRLRLNGGTFVHEFLEMQPGPVCVRYDSELKTVQILHRDLEDCAVGMR